MTLFTVHNKNKHCECSADLMIIDVLWSHNAIDYIVTKQRVLHVLNCVFGFFFALCLCNNLILHLCFVFNFKADGTIQTIGLPHIIYPRLCAFDHWLTDRQAVFGNETKSETHLYRFHLFKMNTFLLLPVGIISIFLPSLLLFYDFDLSIHK